MEKCKEYIDRLFINHTLSKEEFVFLLSNNTQNVRDYISEIARKVKNEHFGNKVFTRGLIEFTNYCKNDCFYCGIRNSNVNCDRYRLTKEEILACCNEGYELGFRTFVLQGGEDPYFNDDRLVDIVKSIKSQHSDCAITLSIGERDKESYIRLKNAGADRYLLRHETANACHYGKLHPEKMSLENRINCLKTLKEIGYQIGAGFMVESPYQSIDNIAEDLLFIKDLNPHMVGIGPFISHKDTPFKDEKNGTLEMTLLLLSILRLMIPDVLLPATTALGTIHPKGRELGIMAGANVVMPNLSPSKIRQKYALYDNKICTGEEAAECVDCLKKRVELTGNIIVIDRGDSPR
mgnify:CR=1 FL=1